MERKAWRFTEDRQRERNAPMINGGRSAVADFAALKKTLSGSMTRPCTIAPTLTESIAASRDDSASGSAGESDALARVREIEGAQSASY